MKADFVFKKLIGDKGFYGHMDLVTEIIDGDGFELNYDPKSPWYSSILFGVAYFYEDLFRNKRKRLKVDIKLAHWQAVDSSSMVMLYVCLQALYKSMNIEKNDIFIDEQGVLHLPKFTGVLYQ